MAKLLVFLSIAFTAAPALAHQECYLLLTNTAQPTTDQMQIDYAKNWVETQGGRLNDPQMPLWSQINILERWQSWRNLTRTQRDRALTLELMKISPPAPAAQPTVVLFDSTSLQALSAENLERMMKRVNDAFPVDENVNPEVNRTANTILSRLRFAYTRFVNPYQHAVAPVGYDAPIASARELSSLGLERVASYYSQLIGTSPSVDFSFYVTKNESGSPAQLLRREVFVLDTKFARENGFVIPRLHSVGDLFDFFEFWEPEAAEAAFRANWMNLPRDMRTYAEFRAYLEADPDSVFVPQNAYNQMAAMRTRLWKYVLTPADAEQFLKQSLKRYLLHLGSENPAEVEKVSVNLSSSQAILRFFSSDLIELLHLPFGLSLRIPIAVSARHYVLSRVENQNLGYPLRQATRMGDPRVMRHDDEKR